MTETKNNICDILSTLTPREERILRMHYGIGNNKPLSLEEIGAEFNVTADRVSQIVSKSLKKLSSPARLEKIKAFGYNSFEDYAKSLSTK